MVSVSMAALAPSYVDKFMDLNISDGYECSRPLRISSTACPVALLVGQAFYTADIPSYTVAWTSVLFAVTNVGARWSKTSSSNHNNVDKCSLSTMG